MLHRVHITKTVDGLKYSISDDLSMLKIMKMLDGLSPDTRAQFWRRQIIELPNGARVQFIRDVAGREDRDNTAHKESWEC